MRLLILLVAAAMLMAADGTSAKLDRIELANGRHLIGTITAETATTYLVVLDNGGSITIARDKVLRIEHGVADAPAPPPPPTVAPSHPTPRASAASKPPVEADWKRFGPYEVRVAQVAIERVRLHLADIPRISAQPLLRITLLVRNPSDTQLLRYESFGGRWLDLDAARRARVADDLGNTYPAAHFDPGTVPDGAVDRVAELYPGKTLTDVLVFSEPVERASRITLFLPRETVGADADLVLAWNLRPGK